MLSCTLQEYKNSYEASLSAYLEEFEDNTQTSFLEKEIERYSDYATILNKLKRTYNEEALKGIFIKNKLLGKLKKINISAYNAIISEEIKLDEQNKYESLNTDNTLVVLDFQKLKNYITSSEQILKFINKEYRFSINSNKFYKPADLIGELPFLSIKQKSVIPGKEIAVVKAETKVNSENIDVPEHSETNDYTKSTIHEYLEDIVDDIKPDDYKLLTDALYSYFTTGKFLSLQRKIMFKSVNKKKVGWALKEVYKNLKTEKLDIEYFRFAKENINLFAKEVIEPKKFNKSNFYKMFTTNPAK